MKWEIDYDNEDGDEGFREWWIVTDGSKLFRCSEEADAKWLCDLLNRSTPAALETVVPAYELRKLQRQLAGVISLVERGELVTMSEEERTQHASRYGAGAFVIGDFIITRRS